MVSSAMSYGSLPLQLEFLVRLQRALQRRTDESNVLHPSISELWWRRVCVSPRLLSIFELQQSPLPDQLSWRLGGWWLDCLQQNMWWRNAVSDV